MWLEQISAPGTVGCSRPTLNRVRRVKTLRNKTNISKPEYSASSRLKFYIPNTRGTVENWSIVHPHSSRRVVGILPVWLSGPYSDILFSSRIPECQSAGGKQPWVRIRREPYEWDVQGLEVSVIRVADLTSLPSGQGPAVNWHFLSLFESLPLTISFSPPRVFTKLTIILGLLWHRKYS